MQLAEFIDRLEHVKRSGGYWTARCPGHKDHRNSLSVKEMPDGKLSVQCYAGCSIDEILAPLGMQKSYLYPAHKGNGKNHREIVATYDYVDERGNLLYQAVRYRPKAFVQRKPDGRGDWIYKLGEVRRVLFQLPEVLKAIEAHEDVFLAEGEKDALNLVELGLCATTNAGGCKAWRREFNAVLSRARAVYCLPDNDPPGLEHMRTVAAALDNAVVVELPGLAVKQDVSDWIVAGGTREKLEALCAKARSKPKAATAPVLETVDSIKSSRLSELATARRLASVHGENLRHCTGLGWLFWTGRRWERDRKAAEQCAHAMGAAVRNELSTLEYTDPSIAKAYWQHAKAVESARGIEALLLIAKALPELNGDKLSWDTDPWLLNCSNGTVDLRTGVLQPHQRGDHITQLCELPYISDATCPRWLRFLDEVFQEDSGLINYFQWCIGYALSGSTEHDCFYILHGGGSNGKSTLVSALKHILGPDYSHEIEAEELLQQQYTRHSTERAALRGKRFVSASETPENRRLNESLIKQMTGGDTLRARFMREDSFEFRPVMKLFISTNHLPVIRDETLAMWRRVRLLPFRATFEGQQKESRLLDKLSAEAPGILAWAVEGAKRLASGEPELPESVRVAREEYRVDNDVFAQFLETECVQATELRVNKTQFYAAWKQFNGGRCEPQRTFSQRMQRRGFRDAIGHGNRSFWVGVGLQATERQMNCQFDQDG